MNNYWRGLYAEELAKLVLRLKGYRILAHRFKTPLGEIDLIAVRGKAVALIEVKQRPNLASGASAISAKQKHRLQQAAQFVLAGRPELSQHYLRFDALLVNRWGWLQHHQNIWPLS
jgi:putative endonuclease